jgi:hypothetical protein
VTRHNLPKVHSDVVTPLIWRLSGQSPALVALRDLLAGRKQRKQRGADHNKRLR